MNTKKESINVVWLKRDLRLEDNEAVYRAIETRKPTLLLYVFEHSLQEDKHYSQRHWDFIKQSLQHINLKLQPFHTKVVTASAEVIQTISTLQQFWKIDAVFFHQETGLRVTYERDRAFARFCKNNLINWQQNVNNGVFRGRVNRQNWIEDWEHYMKQPLFYFEPLSDNFINLQKIEILEQTLKIEPLETPNLLHFQKGGSDIDKKYLASFFKERYKNYNAHISKPLLSRKGCIRLSPYLAWGNLSIRQVWKYAKEFKKDAVYKKQVSISYQTAWKEGKTGYPLVGACMRCLAETGYLNFRMRAMVVSFFTHNLWQPWQEAISHLSQMFLGFEPGIHFPQLQMQAGKTGIHMLRIYNLVKNSIEHDPDGEFIKIWIPELRNVPPQFIHEPYRMTSLDQKFNNTGCTLDLL